MCRLQVQPDQESPFGSSVKLSLRILDVENRLVREVVEDEPVRLDLLLEGINRRFTALLVEQCYVSNRSHLVNKLPKATQIIQCGG